MTPRILGIATILTFFLAWPHPLIAQTVLLGNRSYDVYLPVPPKNAPILILLHGAGETPASIARSTGLPDLAVARGYAVLVPAGTDRTWNAGYCCGAAAANSVDDLGFLDAMRADATSRYHLDESKVYVAGMSNGAMMTETWVTARPGSFTAAAAVSGTLDLSTHSVTSAIPLLVIHGTSDKVVPFAGGRGSKKITANVDITPESAVVAAFAAAWGSGIKEETSAVPSAGLPVSKTEWSMDGKVVQRFFTIAGGGHVWPTSSQDGGGARSKSIDASEEILRFFETFR